MNDALIIFDCDGVLVDSEVISLGLLIEHYAKHGVEISIAQACLLFLGKPVKTAAEALDQHVGEKIPGVNLDDFQREIISRFQSDLKPVNGIAETLSLLPNRKCVASSSNIERIKKSLQLTNLAEHFGEDVFSTDFVERGKPYPDIFLHACEIMKGTPSNTIVVEDSPAGLIAAKAAGMKTIAFTGGSHAASDIHHQYITDQSPNLIISHMRDLQDAIHSLSGK